MIIIIITAGDDRNDGQKVLGRREEHYIIFVGYIIFCTMFNV